MKTIRQIADEIGVSKTAVSKQIANLGLRSGLRKNGNQFAIDEHQEALIKRAFSEKSQTEIENQTQTENREVGDLVCVLQDTIDTLQGQLEVKDRQIEQQAQTITRLTDALAAAQQTAAAAQALHAGTIQQQLLQERLGWISRVRSQRKDGVGLTNYFEIEIIYGGQLSEF
jgi:biotin operon repressor